MAAKATKSLFITFEGIDGCGKTTQTIMTYRYLTVHGYDVKLLREPGSTRTAERIRNILLDKRLKIAPITELLLYEAARAEITAAEIAPFLGRGRVVLCDRFYDSTTAYQGYGRGLDIRMVRSLHRVAVGNLKPDLTFLLDVNLKTAFLRQSGNRDRLESQPKAFFGRVRKGFLEIARKERRRVKVIDASRSIEDVFSDIKKILSRRIEIL
ncbi:MAG: dTMP kinase [candidate division Zixibacteria bacterium]|nr:dTMP kinase [candidate division Zixibacteria bacterium]